MDVQLADGVTGPARSPAAIPAAASVTVVFVTGNPEMVRDNRNAVGVLSKPHWPEKVSEALDYAAASASRQIADLATLPDAAGVLNPRCLAQFQS